MPEDDDEHFVKVELPHALRAVYARAITSPSLASKLVFDQLQYAGSDADKGSSHADILKALAFCFKVINTNAHEDAAVARRVLEQIERLR